MKRWQARGEVLDSDEDEDLELESELGSPAKKAARIEDHGLRAESRDGVPLSDRPPAEQDIAEPDWIQPKVANTYGRKARVSRPGAQPSPKASESPITAGDREERLQLSEGGGQGPAQNEGETAPEDRQSSPSHNPAASNAGLEPLAAPDGLASSPDAPTPHSSSTTRAVSTILDASSSSSEDLPDVGELLARRKSVQGQHANQVEEVLSSGLSSPLSERSISPPPPHIAFRLPGQSAPRESPHSSRDNEGESREIQQILPPASLSEIAEATQGGRRTFRTRKAQQLHPYEYEKMVFQRQWRERGLRPVRVSDRDANHTREHASSDMEQDSWQPSQQAQSSPARPSSEIGDVDQSTRQQHSSDELPEIVPPRSRTAFAVVQRGSKRQKVSRDPNQTGHAREAGSQPVDDFSAPPSPPPTSSESNEAGKAPPRPAVFKFPRGMTPVQLMQQPTPNVSSGARIAAFDSDEELPPRSRPSTVSRSRRAPIPIESSAESSASESEPNEDPDVRRLLKERRRIRGVLPASWLKIDFKAQQRRPSLSPAKLRAHTTESPEKPVQSRGIAQRVESRGPSDAAHPAPMPISDSESDGERENDLSSYLKASKKRQSRLNFDNGAATVSQPDFADDDTMEVDYVDAMLAGPSRPNHDATSKKRQPRIKDALKKGRSGRQDFAEDRRAARTAGGAGRVVSSRGRRPTHRRKSNKPCAPRLSIVDAPEDAECSPESLPQFVKVAMRRARNQEDNGRHSPSRKHIRLATEQDTEDATSLLRAWREGTVAARRQPTSKPSPSGGPAANSGRRQPLSELSCNRQSRVPGALRTTSASRRDGARKLNVTSGCKRQSRLEAITLHRNNGLEARSTQEPQHDNAQEKQTAQAEKKHNTSHSSQSAGRYRGAQLETLEADFDHGHRAAAFERRMHVLVENVARGRTGCTPAAPVQLERFLQDASPARRSPVDAERLNNTLSYQTDNAIVSEEGHGRQASSRGLVHRQRKNRPQRIDAEAREYRQPSEPLPDVIDLDAEATTISSQGPATGPVLKGLGPYGTRYAIDFDTLPLPLGTFFHESSFIGSGDFAASLTFTDRNLDLSTGRIRIYVDTAVLDLGIWNEDVASGLSSISLAVADAVQSLDKAAGMQSTQDSPELVLANVDYLLRSAVRYFARCLAFSDPVDRRSCVQSLQIFVDDLLDAATQAAPGADQNELVRMRCYQYAAVLAHQAHNLCKHALFTPEQRSRSQHSLQKASARLAERLVRYHLDTLRSSYEGLQRAAKREAGLRDDDTAICAVAILRHVLEEHESTPPSFWTTIVKAMGVEAGSIETVAGLDRPWHNVFALLPALEIDCHGILQLGSRLSNSREDWSLCKALVERLFRLYPGTAVLPGSTINDYVRATLTRCSKLQATWGWHRCEPILGTVSDFFARRGLAQLQREESPGSPAFLQQLDQDPPLEINANDRSFQIFLKLLASGLQTMRSRSIYSDKKIGGIAWRFIPNHGRTHRKDDEMRQEDLDALRNHHDLLSTIYYASPPGHRIRVDLAQSLVDHTASHREACRLSVRAWRNLAAYQASNDEPLERLKPFVSWYQELLAANLMQFRLARTEVEQDVASAIAAGKPAVPQDAIESVVAANQRQIAATVIDALAAARHVLKAARSVNAAALLFDDSSFGQVFELFDPEARKVFGMFEEALEVCKTALEVRKKFQSNADSQMDSEDSQDYGDSSALQEFAGTQTPRAIPDGDMLDAVHTPVAGFVSSIFGADSMSDDALLAKAVDVWVDLARSFVSEGKRTWPSYIDSYSAEAWSQLRDTEQRRKYTPYFLARVTEAGGVDLLDTGILSFWLESLVEREATLKYQHTLTNALLNRQDQTRLLVNLPFARPRNGSYGVSLHELRQCRLGLLSSVLSNMHQDLDETASVRPGRYAELRRTYSGILRQLMQAMKNNYQEVQGSKETDAADPFAQGEYVGFVQQVVSFLQQYTTEICPVDRFFTDSSAFPLPAADPTYVVGRLKGYMPKLSVSSRRKELAVFVQTVSERAAVDRQQGYLVDQLAAAMTGSLERGDGRAPSLRHVMLTAIFPAYIEDALSTASSWILALPVIQACGTVIPDLLYSLRFEDAASCQAAMESVVVPLQCMLRAAQGVSLYPGQLTLAHVLATVRAIVDTVRHCLPVLRHLGRIGQDQNLSSIARNFSDCAFALQALLRGEVDVDIPAPALEADGVISSPWTDTLTFSRAQFASNLHGWHARDGQIFVRRGLGSAEVVLPLGEPAEEREMLVEALRRWEGSYGVVFGEVDEEKGEQVVDELIV